MRCHKEITDMQAIQAIKTEGIKQHKIEKKPDRGPSMLIIANAQLKHWPRGDNICDIVFRDGWPISRWNQMIKTGEIKLAHRTIILYLEATRRWNDVPPIKNSLQALCKAIKMYSEVESPRIFVSNHVPRLSVSPMELGVKVTNFTQRQVISSVGRALGHVYELSMYEHLVSKRKERVISSAHKYFTQEGVLSELGCMVFRECTFRESGIKGYWFDPQPVEK